MGDDYGIYPDCSTDFQVREHTPAMDNGGLTVGDLVKALSKFKPDTPVAVSNIFQEGVSRIIAVNDNHNYGGDNPGAIILFDN